MKPEMTEDLRHELRDILSATRATPNGIRVSHNGATALREVLSWLLEGNALPTDPRVQKRPEIKRHDDGTVDWSGTAMANPEIVQKAVDRTVASMPMVAQRLYNIDDAVPSALEALRSETLGARAERETAISLHHPPLPSHRRLVDALEARIRRLEDIVAASVDKIKETKT